MSKSDLLSEMKAAQEAGIEFISFSGGGAKGAEYSGVYAALCDGGVMSGVKEVAGSSAGAITAAFVATGIDQAEFKRISQETNLTDLLGKEGALMMNKDGTPLYEILATTISSNIGGYLESVDIVEVASARLDQVVTEIAEVQDEDRRAELTAQKDKLQAVIDNNGAELKELQGRAKEGGKITFKDHAMVMALNPEKFKGLVVTAVCREDGELTIFNAQNTPDVEIALACRASASIPLVFQPVTIDGKQYVDGGYRDNIPMDYFGQKPKDYEELQTNDVPIDEITDSPEAIKQAKKEGRTLAFAFGNGMAAEANVAIYSAKEKIIDPGRLVKFAMDVLFKMAAKVGGNFKYSETEKATYEGLRKNALNTVVLDTDSVGTLSFKEAQKKSEYMHAKGYMQAASFVQNHELGRQHDANFVYKDFALKVYEACQEKGFLKKISSKLFGDIEEGKELLAYCAPDKWKDRSSDDVLRELAETVAENKVEMNSVVKVLNDKQTPDMVKLKFAEMAGIDLETDKRVDNSKSTSQNMRDFKFTVDDMKSFDKQEKQATKFTDKFASKAEDQGKKKFSDKVKPKEKQDLIKERGSKDKSAAEKVRESQQEADKGAER